MFATRLVLLANQSDSVGVLAFTSNGVPTCVRIPPGAVASLIPPTLYPLTPFTAVGDRPTLVRGKPVQRYQYSKGKYAVTVAVGLPSLSSTQREPAMEETPGNIAFIANSACNLGHTTFDSMEHGVAPDASAFAVPEQCIKGLRLNRDGHHDGVEWRTGVPPELHDRLDGHGGDDAAIVSRLRGHVGWNRLDFLLRSKDAHSRSAIARAAGSFYRSPPTASATPAAIDHRPFSPPVRDQSSCGACWAFATTAASEINYRLAKGSPSQGSLAEHFAPQQLLDCVSVNESDDTAVVDCKGTSPQHDPQHDNQKHRSCGTSAADLPQTLYARRPSQRLRAAPAHQ